MPAHDAVGAVAELAASQHGAFTVRQAAFLGATRRQLDTFEVHGVTELVRSGIYVMTGSAPTWRRALTVATLAGGGAVASHRAALAMHGLGGLKLPPVEVTVVRGRYPDHPQVEVHRAKAIDAIDIAYVDNIPCTTIARTLCDIGTVLGEGKVESILDYAIRCGVSELWIAQTWRRVDRPGPSGTAVLGRILAKPDRQGTLPDSWFERLVERMLAPLTAEPPVRQHPVEVNGRIVANRPRLAGDQARRRTVRRPTRLGTAMAHRRPPHEPGCWRGRVDPPRPNVGGRARPNRVRGRVRRDLRPAHRRPPRLTQSPTGSEFDV